MNKFKVIGSTNVETFQNLLNEATWYNIADVEISLTGYAMAIMVKRENESTVRDYRYRVLSTTRYPGGLDAMLNLYPEYEVVDGEIFAHIAECSIVVISKDNGGGGGAVYFGFDASRSNAIYGASTTVQPPSVYMRYIIRYI